LLQRSDVRREASSTRSGARCRATRMDRPWERAAVRIVVPFAFVSAGLVAAFVADRADRPPAVAFENRLVFAGELLVLTFYGVLLVLVPLVRAIAGGELPVELNARGARFAEAGAEEALAVNRDLFERVQVLEEELREQEDSSESRKTRAKVMAGRPTGARSISKTNWPVCGRALKPASGGSDEGTASQRGRAVR
jgi:hypothetical protein